MDIHQTRRANLKELVEGRFEGNRSAFARATGSNINLINLSLTSNEDLRRNIGEKLARKLEQSLSLPSGWMDIDRSSGGSSASIVSIPRIGGVRRPKEMIPERMYVSANWLAASLPDISSHDKLALVHVTDDTMSPTVDAGDAVIVDRDVGEAFVPGLYLIEQDGVQSIRRMQKLESGGYMIRYDNSRYGEGVGIDPKKAKGITIVGRAAGVLRLHKL